MFRRRCISVLKYSTVKMAFLWFKNKVQTRIVILLTTATKCIHTRPSCASINTKTSNNCNCQLSLNEFPALKLSPQRFFNSADDRNYVTRSRDKPPLSGQWAAAPGTQHMRRDCRYLCVCLSVCLTFNVKLV